METPSPDFQPPATLVDQIVEYLTDQIVRGAMPPGARLIEEALARQYRVSRPPIREALRILDGNGLVVITPRRGARVVKINPKDVADIYACRAALAGVAARLAAIHMDQVELRALGRLVSEMRGAASAGDLEGYFLRNVAFHEEVARASRNSRLVQLLKTLGAQVLLMRHASLAIPGRIPQSMRAHARLLRAFMSRDGQLAETITRNLIEDAGAALQMRYEVMSAVDDENADGVELPR
jgi:DNA-binding GntR family transcriptional regulator